MTGLPKLVRVTGFGFRRPMAASRGRCVAGTVESAGPDVTELKPGDDVYGTCAASFAEFARASAGRIAPKRANLSFEQAAVPVSGACRNASRAVTAPGCRPARACWSCHGRL